MSDGEVEIGLSLLQDLAGGEGGFGDGEFGSDDEENIGEWRLNQTEAGGEGAQRSASISSRSTGLGYDDEGVGGRMADGRESEREICVSDQSRYSVNTMGGGLDNLGSTMARLQTDSSVGNEFVMRTPTVGSIPIPPRVSNRALVGTWKAYLKWEESDPLEMEEKDKASLITRIQSVYRKAAIRMRYYPRIWFLAYSWIASVGKDNEALSILKAGLKANPSR
ncbi:mRNA 3'-end-processing protein rna14 [Pleurotus pulmonarius]|nr:mRNA 3'-end-processing protein rna14 [Pleurotus pulmonarius]KAF4584752.1 mRNA 3'-end-processing protein rna14 [Pleurotus pulmonarius]